MATEKKADKERSVEERLKALYSYQTIMSRIDNIRILRGELPNEVSDLEDEIMRFQTRIQKYNDEIAASKEDVASREAQIAERKAKIARYDEQIKNVRNNREYTFLEKEKEFESLEIELAEKKIREAVALQTHKSEEIARAKEELADHEQMLVDKKRELEEIVSETKQEEESLKAQAKELEPKIDDTRLLTAFRRIRQNSRNGLGIVTVQRNACGGCFNRIPPQRQMEIKLHKKVIVCEYCGRILVDGALVGQGETAVPAPEPKRRRGVKKSS
ncbi:MAG: hypothetical protein HDS82_01040 [Bacteroidales bacterium]|nr:hypothetical protein [Bacteroidales bacterium]